MASALSAFAAEGSLTRIFGGGDPPQHFYALWTAALDRNSDGDTTGECDYTGYARVAVDNDQVTGYTTAEIDDGVVTVYTLSAVTWPPNTSGSNTIVALGIVDAEVSGNMVAWSDITPTLCVAGDEPEIAASALSISEVAT
jgi:hypothetical protein